MPAFVKIRTCFPLLLTRRIDRITFDYRGYGHTDVRDGLNPTPQTLQNILSGLCGRYFLNSAARTRSWTRGRNRTQGNLGAACCIVEYASGYAGIATPGESR